jgi:hypothetical protein
MAYSIKEIEELKLEYGIGSKDALLYLRGKERLGKLQKKIWPQGRNPTERELSNICHQAQGFFYQTLAEYRRRQGIALFEEGSFQPMQVDILPIAIIKDLNPKYLEKHHKDLLPTFELDYESFCKRYAKKIVESSNPDLIFRIAASEIISSGEPYLTVKYNSSSYLNPLRSLSLGKKVTFRECEEAIKRDLDPSKIKFRGRDPLGSLRSSSKEYSDYLVNGKEGPRIKRLRLSGPTIEEIVLLCGLESPSDNLKMYERAKEERTLNNPRVQRKIALNLVMTADPVLADLRSPEKLIDALIGIERGCIETIMSFDEDDELDSPVLDSDTKEMLEGYRYNLKVLRLNQKWLIDYLSN